MSEYRLENWGTCGNPYMPPECKVLHLTGEVYGHATRPDGEVVTTSPITNVEGRRVTTLNSVYILGEPKPEFVEFCKASGGHIPSAECPIKFENLLDKQPT